MLIIIKYWNLGKILIKISYSKVIKIPLLPDFCGLATCVGIYVYFFFAAAFPPPLCPIPIKNYFFLLDIIHVMSTIICPFWAVLGSSF